MKFPKFLAKPSVKPSDIISKEGVSRFASFFEKNLEDVNAVVEKALLKWCKETQFSKEEFIAYKRGSEALLEFLTLCIKEADRQIEE